jgi:hypothetical protein
VSNQIKCPDCGKTFSVAEKDYANLIDQVRTSEFHNELEKRLEDIEAKNATEVGLALSKSKQEAEARIAKKEQEIAKLQGEIDAKHTEIELAKKEEAESLTETIQKKELEIAKLQADLKSKEDLAKAAVEKAQAEAKAAEATLKAELQTEVAKKEVELAQAKSAREIESKRYQEQIDSLKEFKQKLGSALIGNDLEEHCLHSFNKVRAWAFPNAQFYKDTKAVKNAVDEKGTKGDFIFKDFAEEGLAFLSIMFEMKNEKDGQEDGEKNEKFFKKLDEDRKKKGCEFAVLVTQLEPNNPVYNDGIVDVSYAYEKMYVIRPQFFIPLITFLRNLAKNNIKTLRELNDLKKANIDFSNFEANLSKMQATIAGKAAKATKSFEDTLKDIDDAIKVLEKAKRDLEAVATYLGATSDAANKVTVKALTKGNPTMEQKFKELGSSSTED